MTSNNAYVWPDIRYLGLYTTNIWVKIQRSFSVCLEASMIGLLPELF